jgi:hypothetical protein
MGNRRIALHSSARADGLIAVGTVRKARATPDLRATTVPRIPKHRVTIGSRFTLLERVHLRARVARGARAPDSARTGAGSAPRAPHLALWTLLCPATAGRAAAPGITAAPGIAASPTLARSAFPGAPDAGTASGGFTAGSALRAGPSASSGRAAGRRCSGAARRARTRAPGSTRTLTRPSTDGALP